MSTQTEAADGPNQHILTCTICQHQLYHPHLLPCLHTFCHLCLRDTCTDQSRDRFLCPLCPADPADTRRPQHARPWMAFQNILQLQEQSDRSSSPDEEYNGQQVHSNAHENKELNNDINDNGIQSDNTNSAISATSHPCTVHAEKPANKFCMKCDQMACHKCVTSFHRRCPEILDIEEAIEAKQSSLDSIHDKISTNLIHGDHAYHELATRTEELEEMRARVLVDIKSYRTHLINMILEKEKALVDETNRLVDEMKKEMVQRRDLAGQFVQSVNHQLDVLNFSFRVKGQGELLPLLPKLSCRVELDSKFAEQQGIAEGTTKEIAFSKDKACDEVLNSSPLGRVGVVGEEDAVLSDAEKSSSAHKDGKVDMTLNLMTSFHGGSRDDTAEPLLTDLVVLTNGDVILVDRDNKCVKKFNQSGKLLTRVPMEATPSRIAIVSHGRAAVSVMNKKVIFFLSLLGTVQVLHSVKVKKLYSFLTSVGGGALMAGTNHCDSIDLLSESGEIIKSIYNQRPDRASISRPLYLTPCLPIAAPGNSLNHSGNSSNHHPSNLSSSAVSKPSPNTSNSNSASDAPLPDVLVSDSGKRTLFRLTQMGDVTFTLRSSETLTLECPLGVTVHESGLTLLVDRDADAVLLVDETGQVVKRILSNQDGVVKPCAVYAGQRGRVALTQVDGMVKIYSATVEYGTGRK